MEKIEEAINAYAQAVEARSRAESDARACGTPDDFRRMRNTRTAEAFAREALVLAIAEVASCHREACR